MDELKSRLQKWGVEALVVTHPVDLKYLTGQTLSRGDLLIEKSSASLFVDGRYYEGCQAALSCRVELSSRTSVQDVIKPGVSIGFDAQHTSFDAYKQLSQSLKEGAELVPLSHPVGEVRLVKDAWELSHLEQSANLCREGFEYLITQVREGVTEVELVRQLTIFWYQKGGEGLSFDPIVAFGENTAHPHYTPAQRRLKRNEPILVDLGVCLNGYQSDMTRMAFLGEVPEKFQDVYSVVQRAQHEAVESCRPNISAEDLDEVARSVIRDAGYGENFSHSLGHGIGLETHEYPVLRKGQNAELVEGVAVTIEPGIYLPGEFGVRIEDTVIIEERGARDITLTDHALRVVKS